MFDRCLTSCLLLLLVACLNVCRAQENVDPVTPELKPWLQPQEWTRDTDGPIISLGEPGEFDDTHVFAPCVAKLDDAYYLWYSGSTGTVAERVFHLGLATSQDGVTFEKHPDNPVFRFGDDKHSILTATLLRNPDGSVLRENGKLRMWFSSTHFSDRTGHHALYESYSEDGLHWSQPSPPVLDHVYAPTILKEGDLYRMWYTDVSGDPWVMRLATSGNGREWNVHPQPLLKAEAEWEQANLFYPCVLKADGVYLMWYGSYWSARPNSTAIGLAASTDGIHWYRNPHSPVLKPDPERPWESNYNTSQSVIRNKDGSFRIWYASRKKPPFVNKYFAINTATWQGPQAKTEESGKPEQSLFRSPSIPIAGGKLVVCWKESKAVPRDLLIHFHGHPETVESAFLRTNLDAVVAIVNFPGLSTAYSRPLTDDPQLFTKIQQQAQSILAEQFEGMDDFYWKRTIVSSFSAGFGAVRQILKSPAYFEQIDTLIMADSIYAGLEQTEPERKVDRPNMDDFLKFAELATEGKKRFVLSHSSQATPYASTTETADYLLDNLGMKRVSDESLSLPVLKQVTRAGKGEFSVLGFAGETGPDHLQHLRHIDLFWQLTSANKSESESAVPERR